ncbi:hypothetical protein [Peribacillus sp. SCS-155]|uniref:hypothetical protein n=1 Tax=Peribacillus sedimenti TaxID=3115297 RepID=UPI0039068595
MSWINWYDLITPTNPFASMFFGLAFSIIMAWSIWYSTKEKETVWIALLSGCLISVIGVIVLNVIGFY